MQADPIIANAIDWATDSTIVEARYAAPRALAPAAITSVIFVSEPIRGHSSLSVLLTLASSRRSVSINTLASSDCWRSDGQHGIPLNGLLGSACAIVRRCDGAGERKCFQLPGPRDEGQSSRCVRSMRS